MITRDKAAALFAAMGVAEYIANTVQSAETWKAYEEAVAAAEPGFEVFTIEEADAAIRAGVDEYKAKLAWGEVKLGALGAKVF